MKKVIYSILFIGASFGAFAQDEEMETTTNEEPKMEKKSCKDKKKKSCCGESNLFPEAGQIGLSMSANPFFEFGTQIVTNIFGGSKGYNGGFSPSISWNSNYSTFGGYGSGNAIFARYFLDESTALRATLGWGQENTINEYWYQMDGDFDADGNLIDQYDKVMDKRVSSSGGFFLGAGLEMRKSSSKRIQGYYGGELGFMRTNSRTFYEYGNALSLQNSDPTGYNSVDGQGRRLLADYNGTYVAVALQGILGVDYFFAKNMSLGAEMSWGYHYGKTKNNGVRQYETLDAAGNRIEVENKDQSGYKNYGFDGNNIGGVDLHLNIFF